MKKKKTTLGVLPGAGIRAVLMALLAMGVLLLSACGGGGSSDGGKDFHTVQGVVVDPYISGAVMQEILGGSVLQTSQPSDEQGRFSFTEALTPGSVVVMKTGGSPMHAGRPYGGILKTRIVAAEDFIVVSPLTTLLANLEDSGFTAEEAISETLAILENAGISLTAADLYIDPVLAGRNGQTDAQAAAMAVNAYFSLLEKSGRQGYRVTDSASYRADLADLEADLGDLAALIAGRVDSLDEVRADLTELGVEEAASFTQEELAQSVARFCEAVVEKLIADSGSRASQWDTDELFYGSSPEMVAPAPGVPGDENGPGKLFFNSSCNGCHTANGYGTGTLGGDITGVSPEQIETAIDTVSYMSFFRTAYTPAMIEAVAAFIADGSEDVTQGDSGTGDGGSGDDPSGDLADILVSERVLANLNAQGLYSLTVYEFQPDGIWVRLTSDVLKSDYPTHIVDVGTWTEQDGKIRLRHQISGIQETLELRSVGSHAYELRNTNANGTFDGLYQKMTVITAEQMAGVRLENGSRSFSFEEGGNGELSENGSLTPFSWGLKGDGRYVHVEYADGSFEHLFFISDSYRFEGTSEILILKMRPPSLIPEEVSLDIWIMQ